MALTTQQVQTFYIAYLARAGESAGVNAWSAPTFNITEAEAAAAFFNSPEATALYPTARTDVAAYVDAVYNNLFGRAAEPAGKAAWVNYINSGAITIEQVPYVIATGAANEDLQALNGKITVATQYTNQVGANYNTDAARAMLKKITSTDPASYTPEAIAADLAEALNNVSPGPTPGGTFMLTEGQDYADNVNSYHIVDSQNVPDTFKFSNGNDNIVAKIKTIQAEDQLVDLSATDNDILTLNLSVSDGSGAGATTVLNAGKFVNIEEVDVVSAGATGIKVDATLSTVTGIKTLKVSGAFIDLTAGGSGFYLDGNATVSKTLTTIDASGITSGSAVLDLTSASQDLTIIGPNVAASIKGGAGVDTITGQGTITGGGGNDVITLNGAATVTGGSGNDTITVDAVGAATIEIGAENSSGIDTIVGFDATKDKIKFTSSSAKATDFSDKTITFVSMEAAKEALANDGNLGDKTNYPSGGTKDTGYFGLVFNVGDKTYLAIDSGASTGYDSSEDAIVEITGYTGTIDDLAKAIVTA